MLLFIYQSTRRHNPEDNNFLGGPELETAAFSKTLVQRARRHNPEDSNFSRWPSIGDNRFL
jgi:hypothetical protein